MSRSDQLPDGAPAVAVVVLTWNAEEDTLACLESLASVDYPRLDIVVADNGSSDGTVERVRREFPEVRLVENGANLGFAEGNNRGIAAALDAGAEYVMILNNDTTVDRGVVRRLVEVAQDHPEAGVLGPKILFHSEPDRIWYGGGWLHPWAGAVGHHGMGSVDQPAARAPVPTQYVSGCAFFVPAHVFRQVGLHDPRFFIYFDDTELSVRIRKAGFEALYVPDAVVWHKVSRSFGGEADHRIFYPGSTPGPESAVSLYLSARNNLLFIELTNSFPARVPILAFAAVRKVVKLVALFLTKGAPGRQKAAAIALGLRDYFGRRFGPPPWERLGYEQPRAGVGDEVATGSS